MKINKVVLVIMFVTGLITVSSVTAVSAQWEPVTGDIRNDYSTFRSYWRDGARRPPRLDDTGWALRTALSTSTIQKMKV